VLPWKGSVESNQPWVRIPPSPPFNNKYLKIFLKILNN